ncbi:hypothetical protein [Botrimarina hoheduenensis]|uniref:Autotransporter-associated beta strand repeat protein n=1 Tax=Botrimarina hoheduenensis TaxID=2528000 RepID=A0A5C5WAB5_9BACT|nr:hypothetical protein [Botrimarina hoheduenensis]TWT47610.1 hypothetical protein Pla111_12250 [Botrimarina hoheduenensis]
MQRRFYDRYLLQTIAYLAGLLFSSPAFAQPLDPLDFASLGTLNLPAGDYTIDTDTLKIFDNTAPGVPLFTGVADDQNGQADYFDGVWDPVANPGQLGIPEIAVFTFDGIDLQPSANIKITGRRAIALLSHGDATIATPLSVDGDDIPGFAPTTPTPGGRGGPGGFDGGASLAAPSPPPHLPGEGPGGGLEYPAPTANFADDGGAGSFGGRGSGSNQLQIDLSGATYGDLTTVLQGGSGGANLTTFFGNQEGAGGGGAIEINALGGLTINAAISARGGTGAGSAAASGSGSGGGIRLIGKEVALNADVNAIGGGFSSASNGGGGRVYVEGLIDLMGLTIGDLGVAATADIDVKSNHANPDGTPLGGRSLANYGVITLSPETTLVSYGESVTFGQIVTAAIATENYEIAVRDTRFRSGAVGTIEAAGHINGDKIELAGETATLTGVGTLTNKSQITGTGRVEVPTINATGGTINTTADTLTFTQLVTNTAGAEINAIGSTLSFDGGLDSHGEINLINSTVNGDIVNDGVASLAGTNNFTGTVSGNGSFTGTGLASFAGALAPGNSLSTMSFDGDLVLEPTATLEIEIASPSSHDRVEIGGVATLEGDLEVTLIDGFTPSVGDIFDFLFASGGANGEFGGVSLPNLLAQGLDWQLNPGGATLFLEVVPALDGDFNADGMVDAADYTVWRDGLDTTFTPNDYDVWAGNYGATAATFSNAVPEPTASLLSFVAINTGWLSRRRVPIR